MRCPCIERRVLNRPGGLVGMPTVHTTAFLDLAWARDRDDPAQRRGSAGFGIYIGGGPYPRLRVDFAYLTDFVHIASQPSTEFSVGFNY